MRSLEQKVDEYYYLHFDSHFDQISNSAALASPSSYRSPPAEQGVKKEEAGWVQCSRCEKWRILPDNWTITKGDW